MKKTRKSLKAWQVIILVILIIGLYLNRAYAYFFNYLDQHSVAPPNQSAQTDPNQQFIFNDQIEVKRLNYVALGDSLTFGVGVSESTQTFPSFLATALNQKQATRGYNLGIPGAKTDELIKMELPKMQKLHPEIITLLIGINDIIGLQDQSTFVKNYQTILDQLIVDPQTKVIILNIPDLTNSQIMLPPYNFLIDWRTKQFNSIISSLVEEKKKQGANIIFVDLYNQTKSAFNNDPSFYSIDQFHPSAKGYKLWSDIINANIN